MNDASNVEALAFDCVACQAAATCDMPEEATMAILIMLCAETDSLESIHNDLCNIHGGKVDGAVVKQREWYRTRHNEE